MTPLLLLVFPLYAMPLDQAVQATLERSPYLGVSRARIDEAQARVREATALALPTVTASAASQWQNEVTFSLEDQFTQLDLPITIDWENVEPAVISPGHQWILGAQASEALVAPGAWLLRRTYQQSSELSEADLRVDQYTLTGSVVQAWHASARAHALAQEARVALELAQGLETTGLGAVEVGVLRVDEIVPLRQAVVAARSALARSEAAAQAADAVLENLTGMTGAADPPPVPQELPDLPTLLAGLQRPDLAAAGERIDVAAQAAKAAWGPALPVLGVTGGVTWLDPAPYFGDDVNWQVRAGLSVPLVQGGSVRSKVDQARARQEQAQAGLRALQDVAAMDVIRAHGNLAVALATLVEGETSVILAEEAVRIAQDRLAEGGGSVMNLDQARGKVVEARLRLVNARCDAALAADLLEHAAGGKTVP